MTIIKKTNKKEHQSLDPQLLLELRPPLICQNHLDISHKLPTSMAESREVLAKMTFLKVIILQVRGHINQQAFQELEMECQALSI